ncbi:hypothetical protein [Frankia sp. AgB32]|uniref:hypothetical protein n=1 Tax=Frankia sp. AgB32 TaxID=631119 RepID=UPI00200BE3AB|nr:hypothetical protein [Frankia sp. AgB32]MCK9898125.1 hypothetical protein [Frankia sp. AgB32]
MNPTDLAVLQKIHQIATTATRLPTLADIESALPSDEIAAMDRLKSDGYLAYKSTPSTVTRVVVTREGRALVDQQRRAAAIRELDDRTLAAADLLAADDDSERAEALRELAGSIRDHRDMAARRRSREIAAVQIAGRRVGAYEPDGVRRNADHSHSLSQIVGHVVRETVRGGVPLWAMAVDVAAFEGADQFGAAVELAETFCVDSGYALVDRLYACGCRS